MLSPRVLHFGDQQLLWECRELEACESFLNGIPLGITRGLSRGRGINSSSTPLTWWYNVLGKYTDCTLSQDSDKLVAVAGLAKVVSQFVEGEYLSGIRTEYLPDILLWSVEHELRPRPKQYRAPTWSWASVDGPINHILAFFRDSEDVIMIRFVGHTLVPETEDMFLRMKGGSIRLEGDVYPVRFVKTDGRWSVILDMDTGLAAID